MRKSNSILLLFLFTLCLQASGQQTLFEQQMAIGFEEKQGEYIALDTKLINEKGETVLLKDILKKPTIISLVYYRCPGTCSPLMWGMAKFIDALDLKVGADYDVMTISFDYTENIELGKMKKSNYVSTMTRKDDADKWQFFVSDSANISKLTESVGFHYKYMNKEFVHPTGLIAVAADGKITRYLRGIDFIPFDIKITMVEAADGKIGPSINRLLAVCYSYNENKNDFVFNVTKVAGIVIITFGLITFLVLALSRRKVTSV